MERDREAQREYQREAQLARADDDRRLHPTVPEQQMMSVLAELGEHYRIDYQREYEIRDANDRLLTHVDFAWPRDHLAVEVYGPPHYEPFGDPKGDRAEKDVRRIQTVNSAGWEVLIVYDYEITRDVWIDMVDKVQAFLQEGCGRWPGQEGE